MTHSASGKGPAPAAPVASAAPSQKVKPEAANVNTTSIIPKQSSQIDLNAINSTQQFDASPTVNSISAKHERVEPIEKVELDWKNAIEGPNRVPGYHDHSNFRMSENSRNGSPGYRKRRLSPVPLMVSVFIFFQSSPLNVLFCCSVTLVI